MKQTFLLLLLIIGLSNSTYAINVDTEIATVTMDEIINVRIEDLEPETNGTIEAAIGLIIPIE